MRLDGGSASRALIASPTGLLLGRIAVVLGVLLAWELGSGPSCRRPG